MRRTIPLVRNGSDQQGLARRKAAAAESAGTAAHEDRERLAGVSAPLRATGED